jgi:hypothetical protein
MQLMSATAWDMPVLVVPATPAQEGLHIVGLVAPRMPDLGAHVMRVQGVIVMPDRVAQPTMGQVEPGTAPRVALLTMALVAPRIADPVVLVMLVLADHATQARVVVPSALRFAVSVGH